MNKYGVVFADNGHADGVDYWHGFDVVPLRPGLLPLRYSVEDEARAAGYTMKFIGGGEVLFRRPTNPQGATPCDSTL